MRRFACSIFQSRTTRSHNAGGRRQALEENLSEAENKLKRGHPPLAVPVKTGEGSAAHFEWKPLVASAREYFDVRVFAERQPDPATAAWGAILQAYAKDSPNDFNKAVEKYRSLLAQDAPPELASAKVNFEAFFNHFSPFFVAWILYIAGFVVSALAWLGWSRPLNRVAFWMSVFTLCLHTFALVARIYISGRPPVTTLFVGRHWLGMRIGTGPGIDFPHGHRNVLRSPVRHAFISSNSPPMATLLPCCRQLSTRSSGYDDVTCVTGATTFCRTAGCDFHNRGCSHRQFRQKFAVLGRMTYGTLCFAIFFSFVGTVLDGWPTTMGLILGLGP